MADKHEKHGNEKGLLARTATYTTKKARRTTTKLKQRVGKGDETKDEVFDEFVLNFTKQQAAATRLTTELRNYLRCITAMQVAASTFGEAVKDVYEDEWSGKETVTKLFQEDDKNWTYVSKRLTDEVLEPLNSYQKPFSDVKGKIHKRSRKLVDYDHTRHAVDTLRAKGATKSSDTKKLNQAEEEYQKAKDIFIDLTSELYEELPALYDSRIGFYVSCFQSVFTLEEVFHREASNLKHSLNDIMDQLIKDFSAGTYSTRKPFSAGLETTASSSEKEDSDTKLSSGSLAQFYDVAVPTTTTDHDVSVDSVDSMPSDTSKGEEMMVSPQTDASAVSNEEDATPLQPGRPAPRPPPPKLLTNPSTPTSTPPSRPRPPSTKINTPNHSNNEQNVNEKEADEQIEEEPKKNDCIEENSVEPVTIETDASATENSPIKDNLFDTTLDDTPSIIPDSSTEPTSAEVNMTLVTTTACNEGTVGLPENVQAYRNNKSTTNPNTCNLIVPSSLYKVQATHQYQPDDEDELSFEKGDIIHVIPYQDPEEQDDGWLMGLLDSNGLVGVFPENFTKRIS